MGLLSFQTRVIPGQPWAQEGRACSSPSAVKLEHRCGRWPGGLRCSDWSHASGDDDSWHYTRARLIAYAIRDGLSNSPQVLNWARRTPRHSRGHVEGCRRPRTLGDSGLVAVTLVQCLVQPGPSLTGEHNGVARIPSRGACGVVHGYRVREAK
jgi:hypothetical protein